MSSKIAAYGTTYQVANGKTRVNGTNYTIQSGRTCVGGTNYSIPLSLSQRITVETYGRLDSSGNRNNGHRIRIKQNGVTLFTSSEFPSPELSEPTGESLRGTEIINNVSRGAIEIYYLGSREGITNPPLTCEVYEGEIKKQDVSIAGGKDDALIWTYNLTHNVRIKTRTRFASSHDNGRLDIDIGG